MDIVLYCIFVFSVITLLSKRNNERISQINGIYKSVLLISKVCGPNLGYLASLIRFREDQCAWRGKGTWKAVVL